VIKKEQTMILIVETDGACKGNPGPMSIGATIKDHKGRELDTVSAFMGKGTSNIAEYRAAIEGLRKAKELGGTSITLYTDSQLVANQINGLYRVREPHLVPLFKELMNLIAVFENCKVIHMRRERNKRADELANMACAVD
jgi:ribonuclease HI